MQNVSDNQLLNHRSSPIHDKMLLKKFLHNVFLYISSSILIKAVPFMMLPILTRYLSPSDYGIIVIFQIFLGYLAVFVGINSNGALLANYFRLEKSELKLYIGNILIILIINVILTLIICCFLRAYLSNVLNLSPFWITFVIFVAFGKTLLSITLVIWQAEKKPINYGFFNLLTVLTELTISLYLIISIGLKWEGRLLGITISTFITSLLCIFIIFKKYHVSIKFKKKYAKDILIFGLPLLPHALSGIIITSIDKLFINSIIDTGATGVYAVGCQIGMVISVLASSFNTAWTPFLFEKLNNGSFVTKLNIVKYTYLYCIFIIIFSCVWGLVSPYILYYFVGDRFYGASKYVTWIALGYAFEAIYLVVGNYIFYSKKTYILSFITLMCGIINILLNYFLIKFNGAIGAAQSLCITYFIFCVLTWLSSAKVYKMPWLLRPQSA